jgi:hypothetical protein
LPKDFTFLEMLSKKAKKIILNIENINDGVIID